MTSELSHKNASKDGSSSGVNARPRPARSDFHAPLSGLLAAQRTLGNHAVSRLMQSAALQGGRALIGHGAQHSPAEALTQLGTGERLPADVRSFFEPRFGEDFSGVRLFRGDAGAKLAEAAGSDAFTIGQHIAFNAGRFAPATAAGRKLLGHELAHVVQQGRGGPAPDGRVNSAMENDARQAGRAAAMGKAAIQVRQSSGIGIARQEKQGDDESTRRNVGLLNRFYTSFLSSPLVPDTAKTAVEGTNEWLKQEARNYGISDQQRHQIVAQIVQAVGPETVAAAQAAIDPPVATPLQPPARQTPRPPPQTRPVHRPPPSNINPTGAAVLVPPADSLFDLSKPLQAGLRRDPTQVVWTGDPARQPSWTKGLRYWTGADGSTNFFSPETGLSVWDRDGKRLGLPAPGSEQIERGLRAEEELYRTGGQRYVEGRGWLDDAGWQAYLQERKAQLGADAAVKVENLQGGTEEWAKTQGGWATVPSVASHLLGGRSRDEPAKIVADTRQDVRIALHQVEQARTPEELAEAEAHVRFGQGYGATRFFQYKEDVYTGADRTITSIKVGAVAATAYASAPLLFSYGGAAVTLKAVGGAALAGGLLNAGRQGVQLLEGSRKEFSPGEVGQGAVLGGGLVFVPELAPLFLGLGVESAADEFSQGHFATGAFDAATAFAPLAIKAAPEIGAWARPRAAALTLRVGTALGDVTGGRGPGGITDFGDVATFNAGGPRPGASGSPPPGRSILTADPGLLPSAGRPAVPFTAASSPQIPASRLPAKGPLFVDIQGGPAVRADTGAPTFLPSLVANTPGARGVLLEPGDYVAGYSGITTTNARDLALSRVLTQNLPRWPAAVPGQPAPQPAAWEWNPRLAFPTSGPVQVATTPGSPGTTPVPQAFFPPVGKDVVPGVPELIPVESQGLKAQQNVARLQPSTHPELAGQVDRAYWRRPFALSAADPATTSAIGREVGSWLKPGGFIELRLLRGADAVQAGAIAEQIPGARVVTVPRGAIRAYAATAERPPALTDEQWNILQEAAPDLRGDYGALGEGNFARIVRIYRDGP